MLPHDIAQLSTAASMRSATATPARSRRPFSRWNSLLPTSALPAAQAISALARMRETEGESPQFDAGTLEEREKAAAAACTCQFCLEPVELFTFHGPLPRTPQDGVLAPCGTCRGPDLGVVHLECLRRDMQHNRRVRCSVCHQRLAFRTVTRTLTIAERLANAVKLHKKWLRRITGTSFVICSLCATFFALLQLHILHNTVFARDGVFLVGAAALFVCMGCWRYVFAVQPGYDSMRILLSAPSGSKGRTPLLQFVDGEVRMSHAVAPQSHILIALGLRPMPPVVPPWLDNGAEPLDPPSASTTADAALQREWEQQQALIDEAANAFDMTDMSLARRLEISEGGRPSPPAADERV